MIATRIDMTAIKKTDNPRNRTALLRIANQMPIDATSSILMTKLAAAHIAAIASEYLAMAKNMRATSFNFSTSL